MRIQLSRVIITVLRLLSILSLIFIVACSNSDWRTASRESAGLAADPGIIKEAVIEFYVADAFNWRGLFAVHTWIAIKEKDAEKYTVYEVVGWRINRGKPALVSYQTTIPDRYWYGSKPEKILHITGKKAERLIPKMITAIKVYPWADEYTVFPGPNSNTFPAWVGKQVPELELELPFSAIGSGYID